MMRTHTDTDMWDTEGSCPNLLTQRPLRKRKITLRSLEPMQTSRFRRRRRPLLEARRRHPLVRRSSIASRLRKAAQDTRRHRRVESITGSPSAGDHPQTSSTMDPGSLSTNNAAAGKIEPAPLSHLPQDPKLPSHPQKKRPTYLSPFQANGLPTVYSRTELPRRETNLHGFAVSAGAEHQRGEEESEKTYSATTPPPSPRRCRLET